MRTPGLVIVAVLAFHVAACGSSFTPSAPTQTVVNTVTPAVGTALVTSLSPNAGSTAGATEVIVRGAGFSTTVTFGGAPVHGRFDSGSPNGVMVLYTPPHPPGIVDVVVSSLSGPPITLPDAFTYVSSEAFDFNGSWSGYGNNGQDTAILFTIRNNLLVSAECEGFPGLLGRSLTFSPPVPVTNGQFSYASEDGVVFSGWIVGPNTSTGVIRLGPCTSNAWSASKLQ